MVIIIIIVFTSCYHATIRLHNDTTTRAQCDPRAEPADVMRGYYTYGVIKNVKPKGRVIFVTPSARFLAFILSVYIKIKTNKRNITNNNEKCRNAHGKKRKEKCVYSYSKRVIRKSWNFPPYFFNMYVRLAYIVSCNFTDILKFVLRIKTIFLYIVGIFLLNCFYGTNFQFIRYASAIFEVRLLYIFCLLPH